MGALSMEQDQVLYHMEITTGDVRGAGTPAPAVITLIGEDGESEAHVIGDEDDSRGFERATRKRYLLSSKPLGTLKRLHVQQLTPSSTETGMGWYLEKVEVIGPNGVRWTFPCGAWLGKSATGHTQGCEERNLIPATPRSSMMDPAYNPPRPLHVAASAMAIPHPEKVEAGRKGVNRRGFGHGGEDAYFYSSNRNGIYAMGVADGVYAWREQGIDAGVFSQRLMEGCRQAVELGTTDVLRVLQFATRRLRREGVQGSSTVCLVLVDLLQGRLSAANLGDSGFVLLGYKKDHAAGPGASSSAAGRLAIKYRSPQQEHSFGCPYQLGHMASADSVEDAMLATLPVSPGDVVVMGTDGLFDNMGDEELVDSVERMMLTGSSTGALAQALAFRAFDHSLDKRRVTPFSEAASEAFDMVYTGGKADDITVLVAQLA